MKGIKIFILFLCFVFIKDVLISQVKKSSVYFSYAPSYLIIDKRGNASFYDFNQTVFKSYGITIGIDFKLSKRFGIETKIGFKKDFFNYLYPNNSGPNTQPFFVVNKDFNFQYLTLSEGFYFKILNHPKWSFGINANLDLNIPYKKNITAHFYDGSFLTSGLLADYENGNIIAPAFGINYRYIINNTFFIGLSPSYTFYRYKKHDTEDSQIKASYFLNFYLGFLFNKTKQK